MTCRRRLIIALLVVLLGGLGWVGYIIWHYAYVTVPNAYAVWNVADLINDYMDVHDGAWPRGWEDLRRDYESANSPNPELMADLQARVEVDWNADPRLLARVPESGDGEAPFRVIWLKNGSKVHWAGSDPNRIIQREISGRSQQQIRAISPAQRSELETIPASTDGKMEYRPCRVTLSDGRVLDRVYVVEAHAYRKAWGHWPTADAIEDRILIENVTRIEESPVRLPAHLANRLHQAGDTGSGYMIFMVVLKDGRQIRCITGHAVDYPDWPKGITADMVADVIPHSGQEKASDTSGHDIMRTAKYLWCAYRAP